MDLKGDKTPDLVHPFILPSFKALVAAPLQLLPNQTTRLAHPPYSFSHKLRLSPCSIFTSNSLDLDHLA